MTKALLALSVLLLPARLFAAVVDQTATRTIDGESLEVFEAYDDAVKERHPVVVLFHPTLGDGVNAFVKDQARKLASQGYLVLAPTLAAPSDLDGVQEAGKLNRAQLNRYLDLLARHSKAALKLAHTHDLAQRERVAVVGYCHLGGYAAMDVARFRQDIAGVATLWGGVQPNDVSTSWGKRKIKPRVLVMLGADDVETNPYLGSFQDEMKASKADWRLVLYGGATHGFSVPGIHKNNRGEYHPEADRQSWRELSQFLKEVLETTPAKAG